ncbi:hypothetical protein PM082_006068 [Marasmius tenuissimus]|nr:hypothetical protein PM082_006068 [Marasmius tenuissimus]
MAVAAHGSGGEALLQSTLVIEVTGRATVQYDKEDMEESPMAKYRIFIHLVSTHSPTNASIYYPRKQASYEWSMLQIFYCESRKIKGSTNRYHFAGIHDDECMARVDRLGAR